MTMPRIAVLLATFNGAAYLDAQLVSILWQRDVEVDIIARDDGSSDGTPELLSKWQRRHPERLRILSNGGISTGSANGNFFAIWKAVDFGEYDYVALSDQDDVWTPGKLARAVERMSMERAEGYSSDLVAYDASRNISWVLHKAGVYAEFDYLFQGGSAGCTYLLTRHAAQVVARVVSGVSGFCEDASHDWIIYAICRSRGLPWVRDAAAEILYRQHDGNQYGARRGLVGALAKLRQTRSHWYRNHIMWLRNVVAGSREESRVFDAVRRRSMKDRWWLIGNARRFRRSAPFVWQLRIAIALGWL